MVPPEARRVALQRGLGIVETDTDDLARPLDPHGSLEHERHEVARLADPHDRLAVLVLPLDAGGEDRRQQLFRQRGKDARAAGDAPVAAAVEEERRPVSVARVLDASEEEGGENSEDDEGGELGLEGERR